MIPCTLTLYKMEDEGQTIAKIQIYGMAEAPPRVGHRFIMMTNNDSPDTIVTGIVHTIHWSGKAVGPGDYPECMFYSDSSTYRWTKMESEE